MNKIGTFALLAVALLAMAASVPALAQGGSRGGSQGGSRGGSQGSTHAGSQGGTHGASSHGSYYYRGSHGGYYGYPRVSVGFAFGSPYWGYPGWGYPGWGYPGWGYAGWDYPGYNYPSPYYYPQAVGVPAAATAYIERSDASSPPVQQSQGYWYYCPEAKAYHPYVKQCAGGWQRVSPTPPGG